jgi:ABC-type multidrug transport system fused ATPase/permease subunit
VRDYLQLLGVLVRPEKKRLLLLFVCTVAMSLIDVIGMSSILPFLTVAADPEIVRRSSALNFAYQASGAASVAGFIWMLGLLSLVAIVASNIIAFVTQATVVWYSYDLGRIISTRVFTQYMSRPYDFFLARNSSTLMLNATGEVEGLVNGILIPGMQVVAKSTIAILLMSLVVLYNPRLALVVLGTVGLAYILIFFITRRYVAYFGERSHEANRIRYRKAREAFGAIKELRILEREGHYSRLFLQYSAEYSRNLALHSIVGMGPRYALEMIGISVMLIIILYSVNNERDLAAIIPAAALYAITGYRLMPAFQTIFGNLTVMKFNRPSLRILLSEAVSHEDPQGTHSKVSAPSAAITFDAPVVFRKVSCRYESKDTPALSDIDICIPARKTIGIVGSSGAGKSTFLDVLTGLLPIDRGSIWIGDVQLTGSNIRHWRAGVGYVAQQVYLADDTVRQNIALGIPDAEVDEAKVEAAARIASIHDFIVNELTRGYDTTIGENGARLSGGQRQRLGIARALYRDPPFLIFDEATSALDGLTEESVIGAIRKLSSRKTIVIVAHRLATVQHCDNIYVLDKGRVVDEGSYDWLLENSLIFRQMARVPAEREAS